MAYSGATETLVLFDLLPQTTTAVGYTATVTEIANQEVRAAARIDAYCARRYAVPFGGGTSTGSVPPLVRAIDQDITGYYVMRSAYSEDSVTYNAWVERFNDASKTLEEIRDGKIDLVNTAGSLLVEVQANSKIASTTQDYTPDFGPDAPTSWVVDPDKLTDTSDRRR